MYKIHKEKVTNDENGVIAIDLNQNFISISELDEKMNLLFSTDLYYLSNTRTKDKQKQYTKNQTTNSVKNLVKEIIEKCVACKKDLIIEKLNFNKEKHQKSDKSKTKQVKSKNKMLNSFQYKKIKDTLTNVANKFGVKIFEINPAYTSKIGKELFQEKMKLNIIHNCASYYIGIKYYINKKLINQA